MNFIIFDLEATCWESYDRGNKTQEIIEIGAIKIDEEGNKIGTFERFVRPTIHTTLSLFCQRLTSITQVDVNQADTFPVVVEEFQDWIDVEYEEYLLCSWGFFDQKILIKNSKLYDLDASWTDPFINLKFQYPKIKGLRRPIGLRRALDAEGMEFEGAHHRGIDDAWNLARLFVKYQNQWQH